MTDEMLKDEYFSWLLGFIEDRESAQVFNVASYTKLLSYLYSVQFEYVMPRDANRASDGEDLRYRFAEDNFYDERKTAPILDNRPCSVLEMMVALADRCENQIMSDPELGNRTGRWFWQMIVNLGLTRYTNDIFNKKEVSQILNKFMYREYQKNGKGGLFITTDDNVDMREMEIWYQMHRYLNDIFYKERG